MARHKLYPEANVVRVTVRITDTLKEKIQEQATHAHRSLTQEIVALLEEAIQMREKQQSLKDQ